MPNASSRSFEIETGRSLVWNQELYLIKSIKPSLRDVTLEGKGGIERCIDTKDFYNGIAAGEITFPERVTRSVDRAWTDREQKEADFRLKLTEFVEKLSACTEEERAERITEFCKAFGRKKPSLKTIKKYKKQWKTFGFAGLVPDFSRRGGSGWQSKKHLKEMAARLLAEVFQRDDKVNLTTISILLDAQLRQRNKELNLCESLDRKTVSRILMSMPKSTVKAGRLDPRTFALWNRQASTTYNVKRPFERVEVDAKTIDVFCTDEIGNRYTELTLYAMVCARTSYPVGLYITPGKPSQFTLLKLLEMFFAPKDQAFKDRFGIKTDWVAPCGITTLVLDNAVENTAGLTLEIVRKLGIQIELARIGRGDDKPHVETLFNTLDKRLLHKMPGSTKSSDKRIANRHARAEKEACLTVEQIYAYVMQFVADIYLKEPSEDLSFLHRERMSIQTAMDRDLDAYMPLPAPSVDEIKNLLLSVNREIRKLWHYGVDFLGFTFNSPELAALAREQQMKAIEIQFNPEDCTVIYAVHPLTKQRIALQNKMLGVPRISFELAKQLRKKYSGSGETMTGHDYQEKYAQLLNEFVSAPPRRAKIKENNRSQRDNLKLTVRDEIDAQLKKGLAPASVSTFISDDAETLDDDFAPSPRRGV
jgi:putative transposase